MTAQALGRRRATTLGPLATVWAIELHEQSEPQQNERVGSGSFADVPSRPPVKAAPCVAATHAATLKSGFTSAPPAIYPNKGASVGREESSA